jgi:hypothetical protein
MKAEDESHNVYDITIERCGNLPAPVEENDEEEEEEEEEEEQEE